MSATSRFDSPSASLPLRSLLKGMERAPWVGLVLAVGIHGALTQLRVLRDEQKIAKPLTTQFVKRQPRLTKPLELKKRAQPKRRQVQREMVSVQAKRTGHGSALRVEASTAVGSLAKPELRVDRGPGRMGSASEPQTLAQRIEGARESRGVVDMSLEMVDVEALDTGQYHAMVIQDPGDKRNIRGYVHLAVVYSPWFFKQPVAYRSSFEREMIHVPVNLARALNQFTRIKADVSGGPITFESRELLKTPWVFSTAGNSFQLTESEAQNLGRYMLSGGFLFAGHGHPDHPRFGEGNRSLRKMIKDALATHGVQFGRDWTFVRLNSRHPMYHSYFDFDAPPDIDWDFYRHGVHPSESHYIHSVDVGNRMVAAMCDGNINIAWGDWGWFGAYSGLDPTRVYQFGVNTIIFALTQEGSITNRLMDTVGY